MKRRLASGDNLVGKLQVLPWVGVVWAAKMGMTHYLAQDHYVIPNWCMWQNTISRTGVHKCNTALFSVINQWIFFHSC